MREHPRLLLEEKLSALLTDEVYAAEGGVYRSTNSPQCGSRGSHWCGSAFLGER